MTDLIDKIRNLPKIAVIAVIILVSGLIRLPLETYLVKDLREKGFYPRNEALSSKEKLGTQAVVGVLGGLRFVVAFYFSLEAVTHWENQEWDELAQKYRITNLLSPRDSAEWRNSAWHMGYNASAWYELSDRENPEAVRKLLRLRYIERGKDILREAIRWNPDDAFLYRDLANIYRDKERTEVCKISEIYHRASQCPNALSYMYRFYAYYLADCEGHEQKAYETLMEMYLEGRKHLIETGRMVWKPTLIVKIRELEEKLGIPEPDRILERVDNTTLKIITPIRP